MHEHLPEAKLIYVMRDPVDRIVSQYIHEWSQRVIEDGCSIDDAIEQHPILVEYSKYATQVSPYVEKWGMDRVLPVFFERLMHNPQEEFERVGRFLGITYEMQWDTSDAQNVSSQRQRRGPVVDAILGNRALQVIRRTLMPEALRAKFRSRWTMKERPVLSDDSIEKIHSMLDPDMHQLGAWIGRDLSCSTYREVIMRDGAPEWVAKEAA